MSMGMHVLFGGKLPDDEALFSAMGELEFPFKVLEPTGSLEDRCGFLPMSLNGQRTGAELWISDDAEERAEFDEIVGYAIDPKLERVASFIYRHTDGMLAATCGAAALAKLVGGVVFEGQSGQLMSADEAIEYARRMVREDLDEAIEAARRRYPQS